jgi:hypothetical protein
MTLLLETLAREERAADYSLNNGGTNVECQVRSGYQAAR